MEQMEYTKCIHMWNNMNGASETPHFMLYRPFMYPYTIPYIGQEKQKKNRTYIENKKQNALIHISFFIAGKMEHQTLILTYYYTISVSFSCYEAFRRYYRFNSVESTIPLCWIFRFFSTLHTPYINIDAIWQQLSSH